MITKIKGWKQFAIRDWGIGIESGALIAIFGQQQSKRIFVYFVSKNMRDMKFSKHDIIAQKIM